MQNNDVSSGNCLTLEQLILVNPRDYLTAVDKNPSLMFLGLTPKSLQVLSRNASLQVARTYFPVINHTNVIENYITSPGSTSTTITSPGSQSSTSNFSISSGNLFVTHRIASQTMIACEFCPKLISKKNFKAHMEIHDGCRNYHICGSCGNHYYFLRDLMKHRREKHRSVTRNNDKHVCGICHDSFTDYQTMKKHRKDFGCFLF